MKNKKIRQIVILVILAIGLLVGLLVAKQQQDLRKHAAGSNEVEVALDPSTGNYALGKSFHANVKLHKLASRSITISGAEAVVTIPSQLTVTSASCLAPFDGTPFVTQSAQTVTLLCAIGAGVAPVSLDSDAEIGSISFTVKSDAALGNAPVSFTTTRVTESGVPGQAPDVSTSGQTGSYTITSTTTLPPEVAYWTFNEGTGTVAHNTGNAGNILDGTLTGFADPATQNSGWTSIGKVNGSLVFDGQNTKVNLGFKPQLQLTKGTFMAWVKKNNGLCGDSSNNTCPIFKNQFDTNGNGFAISALDMPGSGLAFVFDNDETDNTTGILWSNGSTDINTWNHVAVTFDGTSIKIYLNGKLDSSAVFTHPVQYSTSSIESTIGVGTNKSFNGNLDDMRLFDSVLTDQQIKDVYRATSGIDPTATPTPTGGPSPTNTPSPTSTTASGLIGYWPMDEGSGTVVHNSGTGGANLDGVAENFTNPPTASSGWTTEGKINKALIFNANTNRVRISNIDQLQPTSLTLMAWIKSTGRCGTQNICPIFDNQSGYSNSGFYLGLNDGNGKNLVEFIKKGGSIGSDTPIENNIWYHIVITYGNNRLSLYVNGHLEYSYNSPDQIQYSTGTNAAYIGWMPGSLSGFHGVIDDVRVYDSALSDSEVKAVYDTTSGVVPTATPTLTPTPSATPTEISNPTATPSPTMVIPPTETPTPTITPTPPATLTPTGGVNATSTPTPSIVVTPTNTPTPSITLTPTKTPTPPPTLTPTPVSGNYKYNYDIGTKQPLPINIGSGGTDEDGPMVRFKVRLANQQNHPDIYLKLRVINEDALLSGATYSCNDAGSAGKDYYVPMRADTNGIYMPVAQINIPVPSWMTIANVTSDGWINLSGILPGNHYSFYLKGPKTRSTSEVKYVVLQLGKAAGQDFDWTSDGQALHAGDLPDPNNSGKQDCTVNIVDLTLIEANHAKTDQGALDIADVNYDGIVSGQDIAIVVDTLSTRSDDDQ